jgi:protein tyrosine phosphatase
MLSNQLLNAKSNYMVEDIPMLVFDEEDGLTLPSKFRSSAEPFKSEAEPMPTREGLANLKACASAQFSKHTLGNALKKIGENVWIIDLRKESHGFVNDVPISWYNERNQSNINESDDNIQRMEDMLFSDLKRQKAIMVNRIKEKKEGTIQDAQPLDVKVDTAFTESTLASQLNVGYLRISVLDHHRPEDMAVDEFISFVNNLPQNAWLYFHCRGGKGRSTTFMVMYDMLRNAKNVSLNDIVQRQAMIGGTNVLKVSEDAEDAWKKDAAKTRKAFVEKFYQYAKGQHYLNETWTNWNQHH